MVGKETLIYFSQNRNDEVPKHGYQTGASNLSYLYLITTYYILFVSLCLNFGSHQKITANDFLVSKAVICYK